MTRARLQAGGTFFRSAKTGGIENVNNITVSCTVVQTSGDGSGDDVYSVTLNYTDSDGNLGSPATATQVFDNVGDSYTTNGIDGLRGKMATNTILTMPEDDTGSSGWFAATDDADHITQFGAGSPPELLSLEGGTTLPTSGGSPISFESIRTGATDALFHVANADTAEDGSQEEVNTISAWNPFTLRWDAFPLPDEDLYEIDSDGNITPTPTCP